MATIIHSKIVRIGNSRGIRIPRALLEQAGLADEVEMMVEGNKLILQSAHATRQGWDSLFARMAEHGDDHLLNEIYATHWDNEEWTW